MELDHFAMYGGSSHHHLLLFGETTVTSLRHLIVWMISCVPNGMVFIKATLATMRPLSPRTSSNTPNTSSGSAFVVSDLKGEDLFNTIATAGHTSQGMDHWAYADLTLLPLSAFHYLALLLNLVEQGKPWPDQLLYSRAHLLSKNPEDTLNPLEYRFLMITSSIYRLWGKTRLKHLAPWITLWRLPNMYGGLQGAGADDAWYSTSLEVEHALLHTLPLAGAIADL